MDVTIRRYHAGDEAGVWQLNTQVLGYPLSYEETAVKLALLAENPEHCILIAQVDGEVVGHIHGTDYEVLYMPSYKNILALAVAKDYQHQGIGHTLLQGVEQWARTLREQLVFAWFLEKSA